MKKLLLASSFLALTAAIAIAQPIPGPPPGGGGTPANPTATAGDTAINGSASTYMRSDAAPAVQKADSTHFGLMKPDNSTITCTGGVCTSTAGGGNANFGTATGNTAGNIVVMSNTTTGVEDSGVSATAFPSANLINSINSQTGTSYTVLSTDGGKSVVHSNGATITETLPQANGSFGAGFGYRESNVGAGVLNISTTTSTFPNGATSLPSMMTGQAADIESVNGNWSVLMGLPVVPADYLIGNFSGSANYPTAAALVNCANDGAHGLVYSTSTHSFACAAISGGSATPGGSTTQIQVNNAGAFDGLSTLTADLTDGYITNSANGATSHGALIISGTPGTGTNAAPLLDINTAGSTQRTNRSTNGTVIGINAPSGFTGNVIDYSLNGGQSVTLFKVGYSGAVDIGSNFTFGGTSYIVASGRSRLGSSANGVFNMQNNNGTDFTQLNWGGNTSSFPGIKKVSGTTLGLRLGDDSADASLTAANLTLSGVLGMPQSTWANNQTCTAGQIAADASYIYVCTATNTVKRVALTTF